MHPINDSLKKIHLVRSKGSDLFHKQRRSLVKQLLEPCVYIGVRHNLIRLNHNVPGQLLNIR